jgi:hypothetical protein
LSSRRPLPLILLVLSATLAGCAGGGGDGGEGSEDTTSATQTSTGPALSAAIKVLVAGNLTAPVNGSIPAEAGATLTFDASGSPGAILTYAWDFGDNATGGNEVETHAYAEGGAYNVTLTVTGLGNASANTTVRIAVADDPTGTFLFTEAHTFTGSLPLANPNSCTTQGVDCRDHVVTILAADGNGTPALANNVTLILDGSGTTAVHMQMFWRSPDGTNLAQTAADGLDHTLTYSGDMPPGDYVVRVRLFVGAQASYTIAAAVDYVSL